MDPREQQSPEQLNQPVEPPFQTNPVVPAFRPSLPTEEPASPLGVVPPYAQLSPQKKKHRVLKVTLISLVVLIILSAVGYFARPYIQKYLADYETSQQKTNEAQQLQIITQKGNSITNVDLAKIDKTNLFFAVFKNAAEQQIVRTKIGSYSSDKAHDNSAITDAQDTAFNYQTKVFSHDSDSYGFTPNVPDKIRCVNGSQYDFVSLYPEDGWQKSDTNQFCTPQAIGDFGASDGVNTGGLTSAQADTFIGSIRAIPHFFTVDGASIVQHSGKNYIRLTATVIPQRDSEGDYWGMQNFMWSFKDTGLDPSTHPYSYAAAGGDGLKIAYYVDPLTQLPVYAQYNTTEILEADGKPKDSQTFDYRHVEYTFGGTVPTLDLNSHNPITFSWPTDKL